MCRRILFYYYLKIPRSNLGRSLLAVTCELFFLCFLFSTSVYVSLSLFKLLVLSCLLSVLVQNRPLLTCSCDSFVTYSCICMHITMHEPVFLHMRRIQKRKLRMPLLLVMPHFDFLDRAEVCISNAQRIFQSHT